MLKFGLMPMVFFIVAFGSVPSARADCGSECWGAIAAGISNGGSRVASGVSWNHPTKKAASLPSVSAERRVETARLSRHSQTEDVGTFRLAVIPTV